MPSSTIHLLTAYFYDPDGSAAFFAGSIAPDAVETREDKDRTHLRDIEVCKRSAALDLLAESYGLREACPPENSPDRQKERDIRIGALLHIYTDFMWDTTLQQHYIKNHGEDWFLPYRKEISIAGAWIYHNNPSIRSIWETIDAAITSDLKIDIGAVTCSAFRNSCTKKCGTECGDVRDFILRNHRWHRDNYTGACNAFPPEKVDVFAEETAKKFRLFVKNQTNEHI